MDDAGHEMQPHVQDGGPPVATLEVHRQRFKQSTEHERERLEPFNRPLELESPLEGLLRNRRGEIEGKADGWVAR